MSGKRQVSAFGLHHKGNVREEDQDYLLFWGDPALDTRPVDLRECLDPAAGSRFLSPTRLFVVADGMGGLAEGASAARTACHTTFNAFRSLALGFNLQVSAHLRGMRPDGDADWDDPGLPHLSRGLAEAAQRILVHAVEAANEPIWREGQGRSGSTLMAAAVCDQQLLLAAAGDCRAYLLAGNGVFDLITRDDNLAWEATSSGRLSHAEAAEEGLTSRLTKYLGMGPKVSPTAYAVGLAAGGRLVLCTDGLYGSFENEGRLARMARSGDAREAAERLVAGALARGGHDNISALVVDIPEGHPPPPDTLLPPTPVYRRNPGVRAWLRQRRRRAVAERWGTKAALALVMALGLGAGLWLGLGDLRGWAESAPAARGENEAPATPAAGIPIPIPSRQAAFGGPPAPGAVCDPLPGQVCPAQGDTLESIATRLGLDLQALVGLNQNVPLGGPVRPDVPLWVPQAAAPTAGSATPAPTLSPTNAPAPAAAGTQPAVAASLSPTPTASLVGP